MPRPTKTKTVTVEIPTAEGDLAKHMEDLSLVEIEREDIAKRETDLRGVVLGLLQASTDARVGNFVAQRTKDTVVWEFVPGKWEEIVKRHNVDPARFESSSAGVVLTAGQLVEIGDLYKAAGKQLPEALGKAQPKPATDYAALEKFLGGLGEDVLASAKRVVDTRPGQLRTRWITEAA